MIPVRTPPAGLARTGSIVGVLKLLKRPLPLFGARSERFGFFSSSSSLLFGGHEN